jgi:hypothetical protein
MESTFLAESMNTIPPVVLVLACSMIVLFAIATIGIFWLNTLVTQVVASGESFSMSEADFVAQLRRDGGPLQFTGAEQFKPIIHPLPEPREYELLLDDGQLLMREWFY